MPVPIDAEVADLIVRRTSPINAGRTKNRCDQFCGCGDRRCKRAGLNRVATMKSGGKYSPRKRSDAAGRSDSDRCWCPFRAAQNRPRCIDSDYYQTTQLSRSKLLSEKTKPRSQTQTVEPARNDEVKVLVHVINLLFRMLLRENCVRPRRAAAHVDGDDSVLTRIQIIRQAEGRRNLDI